MSPQRRTALVSVLAAVALIVLKLSTGLATGSLGLISEALHSGTDLIAALMTFFAVGVAGRPADAAHTYGHEKAEHLAALAEGAILVAASLFITYRAAAQLIGVHESTVDPTWYAFAVIGLVIAIDAGRTTASLRTARRYSSAALQSNALHFGSDLAGSVAVLIGLAAAAAGFARADAAAALFVGGLVLVAAFRLMRRNVDVLMDHAPADALETARAAIGDVEPQVDLRRLRLRHAAGRHFADVVIGVSSGAAVEQGHAAADAVEAAVQRALPRSDVVVHVEPAGDAAVRERAHAAALSIPGVREVHNVLAVDIGGRTELSLHLKLPRDLSLEHAHDLAEQVERAIVAAVPEVDAVQTHLEPLAETSQATEIELHPAAIGRIVEEETGAPPRELRFLHTDEGLVAFLTLALDAATTLAEAHARASGVEERIRRDVPEVDDVIVHTEP